MPFALFLFPPKVQFKIGEMASLEEEKLVQMVHDFIESESSPAPIFPDSSNCHSFNRQAKYLTLQEILGTATEAESKVLRSVMKHMRSKRDAEKTASLKKSLVMRLKMDGFNASICQTSWVTSLGCPAGDYEYIEIVWRSSSDQGEIKRRLIVDVDFRSQFELARPTTSYKQLTDSLPAVFIGSEEKLNQIIFVLCSAAKQSLKERGLHVPPWRTSSYMQSKWMSAGCHEVNSNRRETGEAKNSREAGAVRDFNMWAPPMVKPKTRVLGGGSALSSQFSSMGINCC